MIPHLTTSGSNYLYTISQDYVDMATDENGLWAIYGLPESNNNTVVMKINPLKFKVS